MKLRAAFTIITCSVLFLGMTACSSSQGPVTPGSLVATIPQGFVFPEETSEVNIDPDYFKPYPVEDEDEKKEPVIKYGKDGLPLPEGPESDLDDNVLIVLSKDFIDDGYTYYPAEKVAEDSFFLGTDDYYFYRGFMALLEDDAGFHVRYNVIAPIELIEQTVIKDFDCEKTESGNKVVYKVKDNDNIVLEFDRTTNLFRYYIDMPHT